MTPLSTAKVRSPLWRIIVSMPGLPVACSGQVNSAQTPWLAAPGAGSVLVETHDADLVMVNGQLRRPRGAMTPPHTMISANSTGTGERRCGPK